jgi:hypothetical protein
MTDSILQVDAGPEYISRETGKRIRSPNERAKLMREDEEVLTLMQGIVMSEMLDG